MCDCFLPFCVFISMDTDQTRKEEMKMSLLEIYDLTHSFGDNLLYKNAELTLNKGEHIGITGQNGTGKSSLIFLIPRHSNERTYSTGSLFHSIK